MDIEPGAAGPPAEQEDEVRCAECNTLLTGDQDRVSTDESIFCRPCFNNLTAQLQQTIAAQGEGINYPIATVGGLLGGALGAAVWWGFTVVTNVAFGLVAVLIGFTVGKGIVLGSGGKRSTGLQGVSVALAALSFFYAAYLVNRTFITRAYAEQGQEILLPLLPGLELLYQTVKLGFGVMDVVFLGIVVYQAWKIPAPFQLNG